LSRQACFYDIRCLIKPDHSLSLSCWALAHLLSGKHIQQARDVELCACGDNVRDAVSRKFGQMAIGGISTNENDDVVAAQLRALKVKLAGRVERNGERVALVLWLAALPLLSGWVAAHAANLGHN
jgi:hypothetical protein